LDVVRLEEAASPAPVDDWQGRTADVLQVEQPHRQRRGPIDSGGSFAGDAEASDCPRYAVKRLRLI